MDFDKLSRVADSAQGKTARVHRRIAKPAVKVKDSIVFTVIKTVPVKDDKVEDGNDTSYVTPEDYKADKYSKLEKYLGTKGVAEGKTTMAAEDLVEWAKLTKDEQYPEIGSVSIDKYLKGEGAYLLEK